MLCCYIFISVNRTGYDSIDNYISLVLDLLVVLIIVYLSMSIEVFIIDMLTRLSPTELSIVPSSYCWYYHKFFYNSMDVDINININSSDPVSLNVTR